MEHSKEFSRPTWDDYFMTVALAVASRASCVKIKTGAILVKDKRIISTGYNGHPPGIDSCFVNGGCRKEKKGVKWEEKNTGNCYTVHAEVNALIQTSGENAKGATMYSVLFPCADCAKTIAGAGVKEVVYIRYYHEPDSRTQEIFDLAGIKFRKIDYNAKEVLTMLEQIATDKFC